MSNDWSAFQLICVIFDLRDTLFDSLAAVSPAGAVLASSQLPLERSQLRFLFVGHPKLLPKMFPTPPAIPDHMLPVALPFAMAAFARAEAPLLLFAVVWLTKLVETPACAPAAESPTPCCAMRAFR